MGWTEKAKEIAETIIKTKKLDPSIAVHLAEAARKGMEWECENFILKRK